MNELTDYQRGWRDGAHRMRELVEHMHYLSAWEQMLSGPETGLYWQGMRDGGLCIVWHCIGLEVALGTKRKPRGGEVPERYLAYYWAGHRAGMAQRRRSEALMAEASQLMRPFGRYETTDTTPPGGNRADGATMARGAVRNDEGAK
ncbi:hypothetical protein [Azohydromonas sediminis]|uniref:hypothetical protein n=1 Tax=Azohydromonas sediminis TaxID=2259674 RepID=UPI000E65752F|nr:hypothetical protein [Azohydromonas sediminis]